MNKNLKKVISAVAALAISVSSFVAFAAPKFPDVAETANYAQAVSELTALGVVNGYEDGTFGPDKLVTRAEISKMIVSALGAGNLASAEAAANQNTDFSDVTATHWAAGFVTEGVSAGFINGMGDGTFAPEANVTYAQAVKMLVAAIGYDSWAKQNGGYPNGYMSYASQLDILEGMSGVLNDTELNRGQVAILIANAMNAPLLITKGYTTDAWGKPQPNLVQANGEDGVMYESLLTKNHDTYKVYGRVSATAKSGAGLDADEVTFTVEKADNFNDEEYTNDEDDDEDIDALYGDTDAPAYLFTYAEALVRDNDDEDWEIISITPSGKNEVAEFDAEDYAYDNEKYNGGNAVDDDIFYVYTNEAQTKTTNYKLSTDTDGAAVKWYVNGVEIDKFSAADLKTYVTDNANGTVTLVDTPNGSSSSTDGRYDYVMISYYKDAIVDSVSESETNPKIYFDDNEAAIKSSLEVDFEDEDKTYNFFLGEEEIAVTDLAQYDVLSIAYDVTAGFANSDFYEVLVSRDTVTGKVTSYNEDEGYTIDGTQYEPAALAENDTLTNGTEYTLFLNVFGKFVSFDEGMGTAQNIAVLETLYTSADTYYVSIIDQTGNKQNVELRNQDQPTVNKVKNYIYTDYANRTKLDYKDRVYTYSINSSGYITIKDHLTPMTTGSAPQEYKAKTNKIGSIRLAESTVIIDMTDYNDDEYGLATTLVDEAAYTAYAYSKSSAGEYRFVLIEGEGGLTSESLMAVYSSKGNVSTDDFDDAVQIKVYTGGEEQYLIIDDGSTAANYFTGTGAMKEGTPFMYSLTTDGYVDTVYPILVDDANKVINDYDALRTKAFAVANADADGSFDGIVEASMQKEMDRATSATDVNFFFGPIVDKTSSSIVLAAINDGANKTNIDKLVDHSYASDVNVYVYDFGAAKSGYKVEVGAPGSVIKTPVAKPAYADADKTIINWAADDESVQDFVNFALIKEVDRDVTEILVITAKD